MQDHNLVGMNFLGMSFEEEKTLVVNDNSPIVKKLSFIKRR